MKITCPYCNSEINDSTYCDRCLKDISWIKKFWNKSYFYYNNGYTAAKERNLTLAKRFLKKAVLINKKNIEARNLLGLIYYETGYTADALKEWIISESFSKADNIASLYIENVQKDLKQLEYQKESIELYNEALEYAKQKNTDMAIIRLKKSVSLNDRFVRAKVLLGLCYINNNMTGKANEMFKSALLVDNGDEEALRYYYYINGNYNKTMIKMKQKSTPSSKNNINPENVINRSNNFSGGLLYFLLGVAVVALIYTFLIVPAKVQDYKDQISILDQSETSLKQQLEKNTTEYDEKIKTLENTKAELESKVSQYDKKVTIFQQKEMLDKAISLREEGKYEESANQIYNISRSQLSEEEQNQYDELKESVYSEAANLIYDEGIQFYDNEEYTEAISKFETVILYEPKERLIRKSLYYLGCSNLENNNLEEASKYFNRVINEYSDSYEAQLAESELDDMNS